MPILLLLGGSCCCCHQTSVWVTVPETGCCWRRRQRRHQMSNRTQRHGLRTSGNLTITVSADLPKVGGPAFSRCRPAAGSGGTPMISPNRQQGVAQGTALLQKRLGNKPLALGEMSLLANVCFRQNCMVLPECAASGEGSWRLDKHLKTGLNSDRLDLLAYLWFRRRLGVTVSSASTFGHLRPLRSRTGASAAFQKLEAWRRNLWPRANSAAARHTKAETASLCLGNVCPSQCLSLTRHLVSVGN